MTTLRWWVMSWVSVGFGVCSATYLLATRNYVSAGIMGFWLGVQGLGMWRRRGA